MPLTAVRFDCDGVRIDGEPLTHTHLARDLTTRGQPLTMDQCRALFVGGTIRGGADRPAAEGAERFARMADLPRPVGL